MEETTVAPVALNNDSTTAKNSPQAQHTSHGERAFVSGSTTPEVTNVSSTTKPVSAATDESQCELRFLMVNGESFRLIVPASSSVQEVKQKVIDKRPPELVEFLKDSKPSVVSGPSSVEEIRLVHLGKFLEDVKTLKECNFATGADNLTAVHIWVRVPTSASEDVKEKVTKKGSACCVVM